MDELPDGKSLGVRYLNWVSTCVYPLMVWLMTFNVFEPPLLVGTPIAVTISLLAWLKCPCSLRVLPEEVNIGLLPFGLVHVRIPRETTRFALVTGAIQLSSSDGRRLPLFRTLLWGRDLLPLVPRLIRTADEFGYWVDD